MLEPYRYLDEHPGKEIRTKLIDAFCVWLPLAPDALARVTDVVRRLHLDGTVVDNTVGAIMSSEVETCDPDATIDDLMRTMTRRRVRHVPVVEGGRLVGIVSIGDVVKHRIDQLEFERDQLDSYVHQA